MGKEKKEKKDKKRTAEEAEVVPEKKAKKSKKSKDKEPEAPEAPAVEAAPKKDKKDKKRKREEEAEAPAAPAEAEAPAAAAADEDEDPKAREVFMGGLSFSIEDSNVYDFFNDIGDKCVEKIRWLERDGQFKGAGFITFKSAAFAAAACKKDGQQLLGRYCKINPAGQKPPPRDNAGGGGARGGGDKQEQAERTMFVANCSDSIDDADINEAWGADNIEQIRWLIRDDVFKGVGWIVFKDLEVARAKLAEGGPVCKGQQLRISLGPKREGDSGPPAKKPRFGDDVPTDRKVKIANCSWKITEDDVKNTVSGVDKIQWFEREGKFSGVGLICFDTAENAKAAVGKSPVDIIGRETRFEAWADKPQGGGGARGGGRPGGKPSMKPTGSKMSFD